MEPNINVIFVYFTLTQHQQWFLINSCNTMEQKEYVILVYLQLTQRQQWTLINCCNTMLFIVNILWDVVGYLSHVWLMCLWVCVCLTVRLEWGTQKIFLFQRVLIGVCHISFSYDENVNCVYVLFAIYNDWMIGVLGHDSAM